VICRSVAAAAAAAEAAVGGWSQTGSAADQ